MAEFTRALRTLKALQPEQAAAIELPAGRHAPTRPAQTSARPRPDQPAPRRNPRGPAPQAQPNEPEPHPNATRPEALGNRPSASFPALRTNPMAVGVGAGPHDIRRIASSTASLQGVASPG